MNDLTRIKREYGDRLLIHGGWDSYGPHNAENATEEQVRAEVCRCIRDYGLDGNYALFPIILGDSAGGSVERRRDGVHDECHKLQL